MLKIDDSLIWSPECHHWSPPEDAEVTARALADLDEANAKLREHAWQPIETAPRDRSILLYRPGAVGDRRVSPGGWNGCRYHSNPRPYWDCFLANTDTRWCRDFQPTHWMPIPEPPAEVTP